MTQYKNFDVEIGTDGATYTCVNCQHVLRYGDFADPDHINSDIDSHVCSESFGPPPSFNERAKVMLAKYWAKKGRATDNRLSQAQIDSKPDDWMHKSESVNAKVARIIQG